ncbi:glycosyltransferase family 4 protein [Parabacteroides faecis]|uniref:Glycosyltransferase involved in cell wall biosynthesis n=1 Tax=Parabacteroides faecis TaxID=1217282 RepID=A0ABR6KHY1_9BACT|nr:glycosyltransferase family 4 protein [Parabacteroides faecis]MBB4621120.1 glycosyltransferase involved in cell wall biosynthesis [Parabacteroides faecis]GGJ89032.1 glycosyl transferase [Parabacteroides faecis]
MKLAIVINDITPAAGTERITIMLCNTFIKKGHDVVIISCYKEFEKISYEVSSKAKIIYINKNKPKNKIIYWTLDRIKIINRLNKILKNNNLDIIIGQSFPINFLLYFCNISHKIIACEHIFYNYYPKAIRILRKYIYKSFYKVVVLTDKDKLKFSEHINNVYAIPNINLFKSDKKSDLKNKKIISVGRLVKQKGYDILINATKDIFIEHPDWELNIYGTGKCFNELKSQIEDLSLQNNIFLRGKSINIKNEYLKSSIYVMSSRFEGFGLVLVEAAVCGLPIISFDCPNGPSDVLSPDLGILVKNGDIDGLKNAISELINNEDLRIKYAKKSKIIEQKYSEEIIYKKWDILFSSSEQQQDF